MRSILFLAVILFGLALVEAQNITCSPADRIAVENKIKEIQIIPKQQVGKELIAIGKTFLGTPYVAKTLEVGTEESLVITLEGLDCTTFVENVLAFSLLRDKIKPVFDDFVAELEKIRYRDGKLQGYASRLHYFTEWISNNEDKGLIKDITASLGGSPMEKPINFMSAHRDLYPGLQDSASFKQIKKTEADISKRPLCVLSQDTLSKNESLIQSGDIIALATSINGLDVTHTGFAIRLANDRIHLLHASSSGAVEISKLPLVEYLQKIKHNIGITVARPL